MFGPSIVIVWILNRLMGLKILSTGLPITFLFQDRATKFTARMPGMFHFLGHEIVYFGILKDHSVHEKSGKGILHHIVGFRGIVRP